MVAAHGAAALDSMGKSPAPRLLLSALPSRPAVIGVSGGRDSVALLHALAKARLPLTVCHLDHMLRVESGADAEFVRALAARFELSIHTACVDVAALARERKISVETAARLARYRFFAETARSLGLQDVILAHHADDQVETFLFNLLRGAGSTGLCGILPTSRHIIDGVSLSVHRPLLGAWRSDIDSYIEHHRLEYREDGSNTDPAYTRNRMRHEILPMLNDAFGRDVSKAIWKAAEISRAEEELLAQFTAPVLNDSPELTVLELRGMPTAIQRRVVHHWLRANKVADISFEDVEAVRGLLSGGGPAKVNLAGAVHARRRSAVVFLERPE